MQYNLDRLFHLKNNAEIGPHCCCCLQIFLCLKLDQSCISGISEETSLLYSNFFGLTPVILTLSICITANGQPKAKPSKGRSHFQSAPTGGISLRRDIAGDRHLWRGTTGCHHKLAVPLGRCARKDKSCLSVSPSRNSSSEVFLSAQGDRSNLLFSCASGGIEPK